MVKLMITTLIREYPSSNFQNFLRLRRQGGPVDPTNQNLADALAHGQCDARPTVTFPAAGHHRPLTGTKLYCLVTEARLCEQLAQGCYVKARGRGSNPRPSESQVERLSHYTTRPHTKGIRPAKCSNYFQRFSPRADPGSWQSTCR